MTRRTVYTANAHFQLSEPVQGKPRKLTGYAMVWNTLSDDRGGYFVRLLPGSARFSTPTHALFNHDFSNVLGTTANGSLSITPDDIGVKVEIALPDTTFARDIATLIDDQYISGMSFAMVDAPKANKTTENGKTIVNATDFLVDEVTITPIPAFTDTSIAVKPDALPAVAAMNRSRQKLQLQQLRFNQLRTATAAQI